MLTCISIALIIQTITPLTALLPWVKLAAALVSCGTQLIRLYLHHASGRCRHCPHCRAMDHTDCPPG